MLEWDEESNKLLVRPFSCEILDGAYSLLAKTGGRSLFSFYIQYSSSQDYRYRKRERYSTGLVMFALETVYTPPIPAMHVSALSAVTHKQQYAYTWGGGGGVGEGSFLGDYA